VLYTALTTETCVSQTKESLGAFLSYLKLFKSSLVDCLLVCIEGESCTSIMSNLEDVVESCSKSCGFVFGTTRTDVTDTPIDS
jgi:hypothetical protein